MEKTKMNNRKTPIHLGGHKYKTNVDFGILKHIVEQYNINSVIDIGCGTGEMESGYIKLKLRNVLVDGDPWVLNKNKNIIIHDYTKGPLNLNAEFDLAWSVEFIGYVEEKYRDNYMKTFQKCKYAIITDSPIASIDYHHVNFRDKFYWINVFKEYGFNYELNVTQAMRKFSTMQKNYMRHNGLFFIKG